MIDDLVAKLLGHVEAEGAIFVVNIPLLFVSKYTVSMVDFLELKRKKK